MNIIDLNLYTYFSNKKYLLFFNLDNIIVKNKYIHKYFLISNFYKNIKENLHLILLKKFTKYMKLDLKFFFFNFNTIFLFLNYNNIIFTKKRLSFINKYYNKFLWLCTFYVFINVYIKQVFSLFYLIHFFLFKQIK